MFPRLEQGCGGVGEFQKINLENREVLFSIFLFCFLFSNLNLERRGRTTQRSKVRLPISAPVSTVSFPLFRLAAGKKK